MIKFPFFNHAGLSFAAALVLGIPLQTSEANARVFWSASGYSRAINPGLACARISFDVWTRKRYQNFQIKVYTPRPICRYNNPVMVVNGWFESFKISGDRSEACWGKYTMWLWPNHYNRRYIDEVKISFTHKGTLRGMYCQDRGRTQTLKLR